MSGNVARIVLVGSEPTLLAPLQEIVAATKNCRLDVADSDEAALRSIEAGNVGVVLKNLPPDGQQAQVAHFLAQIVKAKHPVPMIVLGEPSDCDVKLNLLRAGAVECLPRPLNFNRLSLLVDLLTVRVRYAEPEARAAHKVSDILDDFLVGSGEMQGLMEKVRRAASLSSTILLTGETGTGKNLLARLIHRLSPRKAKPYLTVQCAALPLALVESEMFGYVRGAFTGADRDHAGKLEHVADGTLFLDEIDSLPLEVQAKLLRAVDERTYEPVGSPRSRTLEARLVAATNRCLEEQVAAGKFRSDLYYRLNVVSLHLPPLRERRETIAPLADRFLAEFAGGSDRAVAGFSTAARSALESYDWPGNIRQLRNVVEQVVALSLGGTIEWSDLPTAVRGGNGAPARTEKSANQLANAREDAERHQLTDALRRNNNNRTHAALDLGVSRVTLYKKLHRYGLA